MSWYSVLLHTTEGENVVCTSQARDYDHAAELAYDSYEGQASVQLVLPGQHDLERMQAVIQRQVEKVRDGY